MNQRSRAPRHPRADGERTRAAILRAAASLATVDGLEGLSIGNLAAATGISKSGLYAHFGSKQELQLATVGEAERIFTAEVVRPALAARPGLAQLAAACEAFLGYVQRGVFPGGCFFAATALEQHELPAREDPDRLAFELHAILLAADTKFILNDDPAALDLARQIVRQRLGLDNGANPSES